MEERAEPDGPATANLAYGKILAHHICVVHQSHVEPGIEPVFWQDEAKGGAVVLPMVRPG